MQNKNGQKWWPTTSTFLQFNLPENPSAILSKTIKIRKFSNYTVFDTF